MLKILAVGDVFGDPGCGFIEKHLRKIKKLENADLVIVNAENACGGSGIDKETASFLFDSGADVLTGGNHSYRKYAAFPLFDENDFVLRPINFPPDGPGKGYCVAECKNGLRVLVISVCGQVFMDPVDSPFTAAEKLLSSQKGNFDLAVCDFHAEATSEKAAFAKYFDGRIKIIFGTHTHVQTADERLTEKGGAFISDIGMVGVEDSVIGLTYDCAVPRFTKNVRYKSVQALGKATFRGALFSYDEARGVVTDVKRIKYNEENLI